MGEEWSDRVLLQHGFVNKSWMLLLMGHWLGQLGLGLRRLLMGIEDQAVLQVVQLKHLIGYL